MQSHGYTLADRFRIINTTASKIFEVNNTGLTISTGATISGVSGKIGVGQTAPSSLFEVAKSAGTNEVNLSGVLYVNSTSGNVGIGTTGPGAKLEVLPNTADTDKGILIKQTLSSGSNFQSLLEVQDKNGNVDFRISARGSDGAVALDSGGAWKTFSSDDIYGYRFLTSENAAQGLQAKNILLETSYADISGLNSNTIYGGIHNSDNLTLESTFSATKGNIILNAVSGNVGIGTTTPIAKLQVESGNFWVNGSGSASGLFYNATAARLGIGTMSPTTKLEVNGTVNITGLTYHGANLSMGGFQINNLGTPTQTTDAATKAYVDSVTGGGTAAWSVTSNVVHLNTTTNRVSIGGTTSGYKLNVNGNVSLNNTLYVTNAGNVGIGTDAPSYKLHISAVAASANPAAIYIDGDATAGRQLMIGDYYPATLGTRYSGADAYLVTNAYQTAVGSDSWTRKTATFDSAGLFIKPTVGNTNGNAFSFMYSSNATGTGGAYADYFSNTLMVIANNGSVGIGTASPTHKFSVVNGGVNVTTTSNTANFRIEEAGDVIIGI